MAIQPFLLMDTLFGSTTPCQGVLPGASVGDIPSLASSKPHFDTFSGVRFTKGVCVCWERGGRERGASQKVPQVHRTPVYHLRRCHLHTPSANSSTPARPRPRTPACCVSGIEGSPALAVGWFDGKSEEGTFEFVDGGIVTTVCLLPSPPLPTVPFPS